MSRPMPAGADVDRPRWEHTVLRLLAYPAYLGLLNLGWLVLALPVVTWLSAAAAMTRAMHAWLAEDDQRPFTNTFRFFRESWRRTLPVSLASTAVLLVAAGNVAFLRDTGGRAAGLLLAAQLPLLAAVAVYLAALIPVMALWPDLEPRSWLREALVLVARHPAFAAIHLILLLTLVGVLLIVPTLAVFCCASLPAFWSLRLATRALHIDH